MSKIVIDGQELHGGQAGRKYLCSKCKRGIHNYISESKGLVLRCTPGDRERCECLCKSMYSCKYGKLHPYEVKCECAESYIEDKKFSAESDAHFEKIMNAWRKEHEKANPVSKPNKPAAVGKVDSYGVVFHPVSALFHRTGTGDKTRCGLPLTGFVEIKGQVVPDTAKECNECKGE